MALALEAAWSAMEALGREPAPQLVTVRGEGDVRLVDLGFDDPIGALVGLLAPPDASAVGFAAGGWAVPPSVAGQSVDLARGRMSRRPSACPDAVRVRTMVLLSRCGTGASRLRIAGGAPSDTELAEGFATDVLRRTLSLPTSSPGVPVDELLVSTWLRRVRRCASALGRRLSWDEAVVLRVEGIGTWEDARWAAGAGVWPELDFSLDAALWMDDGIFARWALSSFPPLGDLVLDARRSLRASAWRQLRVTVSPPA